MGIEGQFVSGILGQLRGLSPNVKAQASGNEIEIMIPKEDIVNQLFSKADARIKSSMSVDIVPEGLKIKIRLL